MQCEGQLGRGRSRWNDHRLGQGLGRGPAVAAQPGVEVLEGDADVQPNPGFGDLPAFDPEVDERTVAPSLDKLLGVVRTGGGTVDKVDIWGKRRLAYDIKKRSEGIYAVVIMTTTPAVAQELASAFPQHRPDRAHERT